MIKALFLACLLVFGFSSSCGSNCVGGNCPTCPCGSEKQILDLSVWCAAYSWDQSCCKCIFSHETGGNANYMSYNSGPAPWAVGLFAVKQVKKY